LQGGTCGVIAAVQSYLMHAIFFAGEKRVPTTEQKRTQALVSALCNMLWFKLAVESNQPCRVVMYVEN